MLVIVGLLLVAAVTYAAYWCRRLATAQEVEVELIRALAAQLGEAEALRFEATESFRRLVARRLSDLVEHGSERDQQLRRLLEIYESALIMPATKPS